MHDINISSTYSQLVNSSSLFLGRIKVKDQHGKLLDNEMEIVIIDVEIISAKSDLPIDKEFLIKDTELPLMFYKNGENSTDLVNNEIVNMSRSYAPDGKRSNVHASFSMISRFYEGEDYNSGHAYGYNYNNFINDREHVQRLPSDFFLISEKQSHYHILRSVTRQLLFEKHGKERLGVVEAIMSRKVNGWWKVRKKIIEDTTDYIDSKLKPSFKRIKVKDVAWKIQRFDENPWNIGIPNNINQNDIFEIQIRLFLKYIIPK
jgi:hypothetical protein